MKGVTVFGELPVTKVFVRKLCKDKSIVCVGVGVTVGVTGLGVSVTNRGVLVGGLPGLPPPDVGLGRVGRGVTSC